MSASAAILRNGKPCHSARHPSDLRDFRDDDSHFSARRNTDPFFTNNEIAEMLGVSVSAVSKVERRARAKLKREIERRAEEAGVSPMEWLAGEEST